LSFGARVNYGHLDLFSAFRYENKLKTIKNNLKSGFKPLQQIAKREMERKNKKIVFIDYEVNEIIFFKKHRDINELINGTDVSLGKFQ